MNWTYARETRWWRLAGTQIRVCRIRSGRWMFYDRAGKIPNTFFETKQEAFAFAEGI